MINALLTNFLRFLINFCLQDSKSCQTENFWISGNALEIVVGNIRKGKFSKIPQHAQFSNSNFNLLPVKWVSKSYYLFRSSLYDMIPYHSGCTIDSFEPLDLLTPSGKIHSHSEIIISSCNCKYFRSCDWL